ncbi:MAG: zinc-binding dehydrogenase [Christensenellaceae bacterium]|jgi:threonine dehydrogenase-like Zn-dependent dehydrogenase|nr:zinc-binding dehydrogenase [Christensenellaceae bacterium]
MKIYKAKGNSEFEIVDNDILDPSYVKLKISNICPVSSDIGIYTGKYSVKYPIVPCHMATGIVCEDRKSIGFPIGLRVILNPYILSTADNDGHNDVGVYGYDTDGFLRDFIAMPSENLIPFPPEVKEDEAIFTEALAIALTTINAFSIKKGEYVAIIGGSVLANIIAQLVKYFQGVPIYVSNDTRLIDIAEKCGIYYIINESTEDVYQRVMNITGGRMADHTILHVKDGVSPHFIFSLAGRGGDGVVVSLNKTLPMFSTNIALISKKQLTIRGVSCGLSEITSAVNMLAQKQLNFSHFIDKVVNFNDAKVLFDEIAQEKNRYVFPIIKLQ